MADSYAIKVEHECRQAEEKFSIGISLVFGDEEEDEQRRDLLRVFREAIDALRTNVIAVIGEAFARFEAGRREAQDTISEYRRSYAMVECERSEMAIEKEKFKVEVLEQQQWFEADLMEKLHQHDEHDRQRAEYISRLEKCLHQIETKALEIHQNQNGLATSQAGSIRGEENDVKSPKKEAMSFLRAIQSLDNVKNIIKELQVENGMLTKNEKTSRDLCSQLQRDLDRKQSENNKLNEDCDLLAKRNKDLNQELRGLREFQRRFQSHPSSKWG